MPRPVNEPKTRHAAPRGSGRCLAAVPLVQDRTGVAAVAAVGWSLKEKAFGLSQKGNPPKKLSQLVPPFVF